MRKLTVFNSVTLDGVMQAPGRPDEDRRGGFAHGGWAVPYNDEVLAQTVAEGMADPGPLLLGRRTYEDFFSFWPQQRGNPFSEVLDNTRKYVASITLAEPLPWRNSELLKGDAADAVAELKRQPGQGLTVLGSGELVQALRRRDLIDEYLLLIHPLVLGSGRRLFPDGGPAASLRLVDAKPTTTGVIIATYRPAGRLQDEEEHP
jgi:dihydrofolate reductase